MYNCKNCQRPFAQLHWLKRHELKCNLTKEKIEEIKKLYHQELYSFNDIFKLNFCDEYTLLFIIGQRRSNSEASTAAHKKYPENFKHSESTKIEMSKKRKKYYKDHPFDNRWRRNHLSYIEKMMMDIINRNKLTEKYDIVHEYCFYPYYLDFGFINIKLDLELDGAEHFFLKGRLEHDRKRDEILINKGWKVYRIPGFKIKNQFEQVEKDFLNYLKTFKIQPKILNFNNEIIEYKKIRETKLKRIQEQKKVNKIKRKEKVNERLFRRTEQIKNIDFMKFGWLTRLSKIWNVSHTESRRYLKKYFFEIYQNAYHKAHSSSGRINDSRS